MATAARWARSIDDVCPCLAPGWDFCLFARRCRVSMDKPVNLGLPRLELVDRSLASHLAVFIAMSTGADALSQELRDAIRAKHRLVEKMKESVVEASDRSTPGRNKISFGAFAWWKAVLVSAFVALCVVAVQQAATSDRAAEIRANIRARARLAAWEHEEKKRWSSERMLRHFGLRRASSLRFTEPVYTFADLWDAVRDPDTHVITVEVAIDAQTAQPAVRTSTYAKPERFAMSLDKLLTSFARFGSNKGLRFVFRDPRAIAPATRAIGERVDNGKIASPIILEAEVAAGPEGYLPEMSVIAGDALDWQSKDAGRRDPRGRTHSRSSPTPTRTPTSCRSIRRSSSRLRRGTSLGRSCRYPPPRTCRARWNRRPAWTRE